MTKKPNILLIMTDQLRADHVGFGGNNVVRTPNLDRLASSGLVFDRFHVANPICMPNRCSIMTGRIPTAHGCIFNDRSLDWNANTFVRQFAKSGYQTGLVGKSHIQHGPSRDSVIAIEKDLATTNNLPSGWDTLEDFEQYLDTSPDIDDFYGFKHVEFSLGHGDMVVGHHYRWAIEKGADPKDLLTEYPSAEQPARQRSDDWWQVYQPMLPEELYSTTFVTERSIAFIKERGAMEEPWLLQCSYPDPHHPFSPPGKWWDAYSADDMPIPDTYGDDLAHAPEHLKLFKKLEPRPGGPWTQMFGVTKPQLQQAMAAEFGMIEFLDEGIGKVLKSLETSGQLENTIIVFSSDHGDMFGDHGLMLKAMQHYQGCIRIPFVVSGPGVAAGHTKSLASSLDIAQTLLEVCGLDEYDRMQGVSLAPVLRDPVAEVRDHVYIEEDMPITEARGLIPFKARTLVTSDGRSTIYSSGEKEVYDLSRDPDEYNNLSSLDPDSKFVRSMNDRLMQAMLDYSDLAIKSP